MATGSSKGIYGISLIFMPNIPTFSRPYPARMRLWTQWVHNLQLPETALWTQQVHNAPQRTFSTQWVENAATNTFPTFCRRWPRNPSFGYHGPTIASSYKRKTPRPAHGMRTKLPTKCGAPAPCSANRTRCATLLFHHPKQLLHLRHYKLLPRKKGILPNSVSLYQYLFNLTIS